MRLSNCFIFVFLILFMCIGCVKNITEITQSQANKQGLKSVQMTVEVISFRRNSGHYSLADGGSYLLHHSTLYVHSPEKYKGMQLIIRHLGDREPPEVWKTVGGAFQVSVPLELLKEWKPENYELYAKAFKVLTDQSAKRISDDETSESDKVSEAKNVSFQLLRLSVQSYTENVAYYYLNGTHVVNHITTFRIESPEQYRGQALIVTHPSDADPAKIWKVVGGSFEAWIRKSYLADQEKRIDWRALKMITK
jgi:hypothetical protein